MRRFAPPPFGKSRRSKGKVHRLCVLRQLTVVSFGQGVDGSRLVGVQLLYTRRRQEERREGGGANQGQKRALTNKTLRRSRRTDALGVERGFGWLGNVVHLQPPVGRGAPRNPFGVLHLSHTRVGGGEEESRCAIPRDRDNRLIFRAGNKSQTTKKKKKKKKKKPAGRQRAALASVPATSPDPSRPAAPSTPGRSLATLRSRTGVPPPPRPR